MLDRQESSASGLPKGSATLGQKGHSAFTVANSLTRSLQRPRKTQLMAVGIGQVKVAFAPFGVAGSGRGLMARLSRALVKGIDIVDVEDKTSPP